MSEERSTQGGRKTAPWVVLGVTLLVVGVAVFAYVSPETFEGNGAPGGQTDARVVVRGSSCAPLAAAHRALDEGSNLRFVSSVRAAERAAIHALDTDFVAFGRPEEMALRIGAETLNQLDGEARERISARLELADTACQRLQS